MSKLMISKALRQANVKKTALYNAMGCRHGSIHYRRSQPQNGRHSNIATLLWYAINALPKRK